MNFGDFVHSEETGEDYEVIGSLGSGGFGAVWRVNRLSDNQHFAMKTPDSRDIHLKIKALKKEYNVLCDLRIKGVPNVVYAEDICYYFDTASNKLPAIVMTLAKGESIATWMLKGPISEDDTIDIGTKICETVLGLHESGYIHRDIKPENVMLDDLGGRNEVTFIDLGIAALKAENETHAMVSMFAHSHHWSPPEQKQDSAQVSIGNDIFSTGATIFAMLLGSEKSSNYWARGINPPHDIHNEIPSINKATRDVIYKSTWHERSGRFSTMNEMILAIGGGIPDTSLPRIIADGKAFPLTGDGPWIIGRKCELSGKADIPIIETSSLGNYIHREHAIITKLSDNIFSLKRHPKATKNGVWCKLGSRWGEVPKSGLNLGARYELLSLGYTTNPPSSDIRPGAYKEFEFFPPSGDESEIL